MKEDSPAMFWLQQHPSKLKLHDFQPSWPFAELAPIRSSQTMLQCLPPVESQEITWNMMEVGKELTNSHDHTGSLTKIFAIPDTLQGHFLAGEPSSSLKHVFLA